MDWNEKLSTGVDQLDEQHKAILRELDELENATVEGRTMLAVYALSHLSSHTRVHFATEEALMRAAGYPDLEQHIAEHVVFRAKIKSLLETAIFQDISMEIVNLVKSWVIDHIQEADMKYIPYLNQAAADKAANKKSS